MKSSTRLDSATFQLTPTRTRCDLIISARGKSEKIASGLLNPFLAHLKIAQEQMAKGGYSIILEPDHHSDRTWFTKGIMERFVRFVSTPEILERVYTIELEIIQIEEAIVIQGNNDMRSNVAIDKQGKPTEIIEVSKSLLDATEEKAIVLYKPGANPLEENGHTVSEENSKVQLLKVLETRKSMLQKEQGMAFARAVAAGFDIDQMSPLISFAESFGALRLMDACMKFKELWKRKHESGQWLEIEAAEVLSNRPDFPMSTSGIILTSVTDKETEFREAMPESQIDPSSTNKGNATNGTSADGNPPLIHQSPPGHQEYLQGQYPHHVYPPWPINSPPGALPVFHAYPVQGMPYYPNYPGNRPFFHPHYPVTDESRLKDGKKVRHRRHSMDGRDSTLEPESSESEKEASEDLRKSGQFGKKKSSTVVIRNINYIAPKRHNWSGSETESLSESENGDGDSQAISPEINSKNSIRSSKSKGKHLKLADQSDIPAKIVSAEADGHWRAFQNLLLRDADEDKHHVDKSMFTMEKESRQKRRQNNVSDDPLAIGGQDTDEIQGVVVDLDRVTGKGNRISRASNDELLLSRKDSLLGDGRSSRDGLMNVQRTELDGGRNGYRRTCSDDLMVYGQKSNPSYSNIHLDPLAVNGFGNTNKSFAKSSSNNLDDDSYMVPFRSISIDAVEKADRNTVDMDSEIPSSIHKAESLSNRVTPYEPDELILMPKRETENGPAGYDPASEYEMQGHVGKVVAQGKGKEVATDSRQGTKKLEKDRKQKGVPDRKVGGPIRKGKPSKLSPLDEARARAEKLRTYKADLQKMKKEKEDEAIKRIEALKLERQKRIAARGNSGTAQSSLPSQLTRKQLPTKMSPNSQKGSKFSDSDPGPSSPLQRFSIRTSSIGSNDSNKGAKLSKLTAGNNSAGNRLSQSVPSLAKLKKENTDATNEKKVSMDRIRRLSEPKMSSSNHASVKMRNIESASKAKVTNETESKKKISAIMNLDKSKAATLPELKIRTSKAPDTTLGNSAAKITTQSMKLNNSSVSEGASMDRKDVVVSYQNEVDDNPVIEKNVVMLECEKPSIPSDLVFEENLCDGRRTYGKHKVGGTTNVPAGVSAIDAPTSQIRVSSVNSEPIKHQLQSQLHSHKATEMTSGEEKEAPKFSSPSTNEKSYQAPHARVSSMEDPCTGVSEYGKATPSVSGSAASGTDAAKVYVSDGNSQLEKTPGALEKPEVKKSSKGLKLLLKFGRKNHSSAAGEHNDESDNLISTTGSEVDASGTNTSSFSEVATLKNLISQEETPTASKTQKSSRPFSLLSPFRSKSSEKKLTT